MDARRATGRALEALTTSLRDERGVRVVAAGKAAIGMARAAEEALGGRFESGVVTATAPEAPASPWRFFAASHPRPGAASEAAGRAALELADQARQEQGLLLVLLSGGASSMLAVPAGNLSIEDKSATTACLLRAGIDISAVNLVRRHLSAVKGGQLAARAGRSITLAISDVCTPVEDDPKVIGSGPTAGDDTTFEQALELIAAHHLTDRIPAGVLDHLRRGAAGHVPGPVPSDSPALRHAAYWVVASRHDAMKAARETAIRLGYAPTVVDPPTVGDARGAFSRLAPLAAHLSRPACLIASGETTVEVRGSGRGGRNQELALAALPLLAQLAPAAFASTGTDGVDGPTDAGGALVDSETFAQLGPTASARIEDALARNDSYPLLDSLRALIRSGPTGTNVGDLQVLLLPER